MRKTIGRTIILLCMVFLFVSCNFFKSFEEPENFGIQITSLSLAKSNISVSVGEMSYIAVSVKPTEMQKDVVLTWTYDKNIISIEASSWGATITGLKEGQTNLKCSYNGYESSCVITVKGFSETYEEIVDPYIYSNTSIIQTAPGVSEKVFVSLYGGTAADIDGYSWTIDNPSVATIEPTGQYCMITAKGAGYARVKITHTKATYPYYMGIYVFEDATNVSYITTTDNILTMNLEDAERTISVNLVNGKKESSDSSFSWEIINEDSNCPIKYETNGNKAVITPNQSGSCTLRVTHPDAAYPLDILCRVISVVKNVYIEPDNTVITLSGQTEKTIKSTLKNIDISEYDIDGFTYVLDDYNVAEIVGWVGNEVMLKGKANGSCKLIISHEKTAYSREVLVIVNGQLTDAIDSSCYITTSQNYIRTKVGAEGTYLNISLKGGEPGDEKDFTWSIKSTTSDGSVNDVISMDTSHGKVSQSRAAALSYTFGQSFIEPKKEGIAVITISHPKVVYPTEILVKVLSEDSILEEPLYFSGQSMIRLLNGTSVDFEINLNGENKKSEDEQNIVWNCDNPSVQVNANCNIANITAPALGSGNTISTLTITHNKADAEKKVMILTADTETELYNIKALYSNKLYYNIGIGDTVYCMTHYVGFDLPEIKVDDEGNEYEELVSYDFSHAKWTVEDSSICSVEKDENNPLIGKVIGKKAGRTTVTISVKDSENNSYACSYEITVYPEGSVQTEPEVYFTTTQNVVNLSSAGIEKQVFISAINLDFSNYSEIQWDCDNEEVANVVANGDSATVKAVGEGETIIYVSHPDSQNTLKIYVRVGNEYVIQDSDLIVYISSEEVITLLNDDPAQRLDALLVNYTEVDKSGFSFTIDNENVATISSQSTNGIAYIKPIGSGQAEITITHPKSEIDKKVLVVVGNSAEELAGYTYLTTGSNVVAVGEGNTKTVSVSVKNSEEIILDGYTWTSSDPGVVSVIDQGSTAVFTGNSIGTAIITVTNKSCSYPLQIIAQCVDPIAAAANPFIQLTSSVLTLNVSSSYSSITADLVGGTEADFSDFVWTSNDTSVCAVYGQNEVGKIRALQEGTAYITVSHPKAAYPAQILVVCDKVEESECYISVPSSIINMKPTDSAQTITASLINGTTTDKYNFTWSLDVYDVIDFVYSANVCTIEPKQQGQATITIHHPKSAYDQQIVVTVQEYTTFAFPQEYVTLTQGTVSFETMQVPNTKVSTYVKYSVDNSEICSISGTKNTAQITAISPGTTNVHAELIASSTGVVQASAEMMVYVKEAPANACYITSSSTIYTVQKGKSQTLSANLTGNGVVTSDQQNLKWSSSDTDIISIAGIKTDGTVTGQSIYLTAVAPGEALITCSHEKAASDLQFYVVVPGSAEKSVTFNKSYITLVKGSSGTSLKATIDNAESSNDYNELIWTVSNVGENEVCRVMGSGQNVTIYPLNVGEAEVMAQLPDSSSVAKCTVLVEAGKSFTMESNAAKVQPYGVKKVKYIVSPANANLTWTMNQSDEFFTYRDLGCDENGVGYVEIEGIKEGSGNLYCVTDGNAKGNLQVRVAWDYELSLAGKTNFSIKPTERAEVEYKVNPSYANMSVISNYSDFFDYSITDNGDGTGKITFIPKKEANDIVINITATNPNNGDELVGTKKIMAKFQYEKLTPKVEIVSQAGKHSIIDNGSIKLGDGESLELRVSIQEDFADGVISDIKFIPVNNEKNYAQGGIVAGNELGTSYTLFSIKNMQSDVIKKAYQYRILKLKVPYKMIGDEKVYVDWKNDLRWRTYEYSYSEGIGKWKEWYHDDYFTLAQVSTFGGDSSPAFSTNWYQGYYYDENGESFTENVIDYSAIFSSMSNLLEEDSTTSTESESTNTKPKSITWHKEEDPSFQNVIMTKEEFENCAWLYCPGTPSAVQGKFWVTNDDYVNGRLSRGTFGTGQTVTITPRVMTDNVEALFEELYSVDTNPVSTSYIGYIQIKVNHLNKTPEYTQIPVYSVIRNCPFNYSK